MSLQLLGATSKQHSSGGYFAGAVGSNLDDAFEKAAVFLELTEKGFECGDQIGGLFERITDEQLRAPDNAPHLVQQETSLLRLQEQPGLQSKHLGVVCVALTLCDPADLVESSQ